LSVVPITSVLAFDPPPLLLPAFAEAPGVVVPPDPPLLQPAMSMTLVAKPAVIASVRRRRVAENIRHLIPSVVVMLRERIAAAARQLASRRTRRTPGHHRQSSRG
ncbi:MAG: hypothetical protein FWF28_04900, partial [Micrococcales bacterium]|nr:hypothetical protein [Micrococcales bacterium]